MALLHIEGFEWLTNTITRDDFQTEMERWWVDGVDTGTGIGAALAVSRGSFYGLALASGGQDFRTRKLRQPDNANTTCIIGFYLSTPTTFSNNIEVIRVWCGETVQCTVETNSDGTVDLMRSTSILLGTSTFAFATNTEYYVEFKFVIDDSAGSIEMKVADLTSDDDAETVTEWTLGTVDTKNSTSSFEVSWDQIHFGAWGTGTTILDDIYIADGSGSENNDFLGNLTVETINPNGAGSQTDLTPSAGSNWENVDDGTPDDDATYNTADADAEVDLYDMSNLSEAGDVVGVQIQADVRVTEGNPRKITLPVREGSTTEDGVEFTVLTDTYGGRWRMIEENPDTTSLWTNAEVNSIECGIQRES